MQTKTVKLRLFIAISIALWSVLCS